MYTIQTNASGARSMEISEETLQTIQKYSLFQHLIDSTGIVDEYDLDKLKLNVRSLITSTGQLQGTPRSLHRCDLSQQHEGVRLAPAHPALHQVGEGIGRG